MQETECVELETITLYSDKQLALLEGRRVPEHIAIIMDGNRRWAKRQGLPAFQGHRQGAKQLDIIVKAAMELGVHTLTVFAFSTENWKRTEKEVTALMHLLKNQLWGQKERMRQAGIKLSFIGDIEGMPRHVRKVMQEVMDYTILGEKFELVIALNYGSRDEIVRATKKLGHLIAEGQLDPEVIDASMIETHLDTAGRVSPDLLIRTSGEYRLSNFLLWQLSYSEVFVSQACWPEFSHIHFLDVVLDFQKRSRRYGG